MPRSDDDVLRSSLRAASLHLSSDHFRAVEPAVVSWLEGGERVSLANGETVFTGGSRQDYYLVSDGFLVGTLDGDATYPYFESMIIEEVRPEDCLPNKKLQDGVDFVSCHESTVWRVPRDHHLACLKCDSFTRFMYMRRSVDFRIAKNLLYVHLVSKSDEKLARLLIFLSNFSGKRNDDDEIEVAIDQHLLAGLCGLKRPYLNTLLKKWADQNMIRTGFKKVILMDEKAVARVSKIDFYQKAVRIKTPSEWT